MNVIVWWCPDFPSSDTALSILTASLPSRGTDSQSVTIYFIVCVGYFALSIFLHVPPATTIIWKVERGTVFLGLLGPHIHSNYLMKVY